LLRLEFADGVFDAVPAAAAPPRSAPRPRPPAAGNSQPKSLLTARVAAARLHAMLMNPANRPRAPSLPTEPFPSDRARRSCSVRGERRADRARSAALLERGAAGGLCRRRDRDTPLAETRCDAGGGRFARGYCGVRPAGVVRGERGACLISFTGGLAGCPSTGGRSDRNWRHRKDTGTLAQGGWLRGVAPPGTRAASRWMVQPWRWRLTADFSPRLIVTRLGQ